VPLDTFHPATAGWFRRAFEAPTAAQAAAWPRIASGRHVLVAAPTGSGKTLTAFLAALDDLVRRGLAAGGLPDQTAVVYVSPLKALSNDIRVNLEAPLAGIRAELAALGLPDVEIRTAVRTGDTPARERQQVVKCPPHVFVTTPESLYVLLGSVSGRAMLQHARTVIVDEIHALAANKRGSHLALTLERLEALAGRRLQRIGLSATQKPIEEVARFLVGAGAVRDGVAECDIVDVGHVRARDLTLELPPTPLGAVMSNDQWEQLYSRVAELVRAHRTTLVFVNTRRTAERAARHLGERLGKDAVAAHHGSLAKESRHDAEQRLKRGQLQVLVATASLELGIDIGDVDLVCQIASPRAIATFLQRAGRAGHQVGGVPKARLFPTSRDELVECAALLDAIRRGELDALHVLAQPLDVLAQQIVAETACRECEEDGLYALVRRAWPYARLERAAFDAVVRMVSEGYTTRQGTRAGLVHRDAVHHRLRERRGTRLVALTSGGTIPESADYQVLLEPQATHVGTVNEDFAVESLAGDVFQLGNTSYRILRIQPGRVRVEDAQGAPPSIPFWLGEAPGRTDELSLAVSRLRSAVQDALARGGVAEAARTLVDDFALDAESARQTAEYLAQARAALGALPTHARIVMERFFDASGGMQLVIHTPFGSRLNRAWGLALRKRFCRTFNFELQAAATEDAIILSLSTSHSFALDEVVRYLHSATAHDVLVQALLDAPMFNVRWRWNATTALALPRFMGGKKVPPQIQRMRAEDLLAAVFPEQVACAENLSGPREIPDHPLVAQTLRDCLEEGMDAPGFLALLRRLESGAVEVVVRDLPAPSPLAAEAITARPYAYLDDAPIEERRTQAVQSRRWSDPESADDLGALDLDAIEAVRQEAWPAPRGADEMHEALVSIGALADAEARREPGWAQWLEALRGDGRALCAPLAHPASTDVRGAALWLAVERGAALGAALPVTWPAGIDGSFDTAPSAREAALRELLRARLGALGPVSVEALAAPLALPAGEVAAALGALQAEGVVLRGRFTPGAPGEQWCERHLLARIHRYTLRRLRREIEPVEPRDYARFLFEWQHVAAEGGVRGPEVLESVLEQLEGYEAPAALWETEILPARVRDYEPGWLDDLCTAGRVQWLRLRPLAADLRGGGNSLRATPVLLLARRSASAWVRVAPPAADDAALGARAQRVAAHLGAHGASFFDDIADGTRLLRAELEDALAELVVRGRVTCDSTAGLRALLVPPSRREARARRGRSGARRGLEDAGRWSLLRAPAAAEDAALSAAAVEHVARALLKRYGVICWRLLEREAAWLPPWRELVRVLRRLEARGEIRGGRFIAGLSGEQYALPEAVAWMREIRRRGDAARDPRFVCLAACDPANLVGGVVHGPKVPRIAGARVLWRDGVPVATALAGEIALLVALGADDARAARRLLTLDPAWRDASEPAVEAAHPL
jgi:ATP-dependent Lhr-like helicase